MILSVMGYFLLTGEAAALPTQHTRHFAMFASQVPEFNANILRGVDAVQANAPDGGGYFIGIHANPPESPVGYALSLSDNALLAPPRGTSYCSGSSYSAFVEGLNLFFAKHQLKVSAAQAEQLRMQEQDGGRREDGVKFWGWWNADGYGNQFAIVQYAKAGHQVFAADALPGDLLNISWKSGLGHSTVFLGFQRTSDNQPGIRFWSSQKSTNGFGDMVAPIAKIKEYLFVRVSEPSNVLRIVDGAVVNPKRAVGEVPSENIFKTSSQNLR